MTRTGLIARADHSVGEFYGYDDPMPRRKVLKICQSCDAQFRGQPSQKFCGRECYYLSLAGREITWGDKISEAMTGKILTEEHRQKLRTNHRGMEGKKHSPETVEKMRQSAIRRIQERPHTIPKPPPGNKPFLGKKHTDETRQRMSESKKGEGNPQYGRTGERSPKWKGDDVGYFGVHDWMTANYGQPKHCEDCGTTDSRRRYEWANISGEYQVWRVAHPFEAGFAVRLIVWFPSDREVVVALFSADKANMGDVFYDSVGTRADAAIDSWKMQTDRERPGDE